MLYIGISEQNRSLVYEGDGTHGHALWPSPTLSIASVLRSPDDIGRLPQSSFPGDAQFVFREDSFDSVTRIRRGRMYKTPGTQPQDWNVQPHPAYQEEQAARNNGGWLRKRVNGFQAWPAMRELGGPLGTTLIALGTKDAYTLWRVVDVERIFTGEDLMTLRARNALGVLPELNPAAIPEDGKAKLAEVIGRLNNAAYRAGPEDVIEAARAAAQWILGVYLADREHKPELRLKDIGQLPQLLEDMQVLKSLAQILARLHSRTKLNEQERYDTRPVLEGDAEYALAAVGMLLRELDWAA